MCVEYSIKKSSLTGYLVFVVLFNDYTLNKVRVCLDPKLNAKYSICIDELFKEKDQQYFIGGFQYEKLKPIYVPNL